MKNGHQEHPAFPAQVHSADDHGHHLDHTHGENHTDHGSMKSYTIGFVLAVILTVIPFWIVMGGLIEKSSTTGLVLLGLAAVQVVVHMVYFLHMNSKSEGGWNMLALIFSLMVVVIMLAGSLWVMYHMNTNMMPGMMDDPTHEIHEMK
jgi:cytochrome o ubiquinol oxidase operon protein cyoD